jgi:hypothetical protein
MTVIGVCVDVRPQCSKSTNPDAIEHSQFRSVSSGLSGPSSIGADFVAVKV